MVTWIIENLGLVILILSALASICTLFLSKPEKKRLAILTSVLIVIPTLFNLYELNQRTKAQQQLKIHIYRQLSVTTIHLLNDIRDMVFFASDGWLPDSDDEFFSLHTANIICNHLNLDSASSSLPERSWRNLIYGHAERYRTEFEQIIRNYGNNLDAGLIEIISRVVDTKLLKVFPMMIHPGVHASIERYLGHPVKKNLLLCAGGERIMADDFSVLRELYEAVRKVEERYVKARDWSLLAVASNPHWGKERIGEDRIEVAPKSNSAR